MPSIIALFCPVCGAPFKPGDEKCHFCGAYIFIKPDLPKLDHHTLNQAVIQDHIKEFRQRIRADAFDEAAHYGLGMAYFSLGLTSEAVDELTQAAKLMPENPSIQAQLAVALRDAYKAGNVSAQGQMHSRLQRALLLEPRHSEALLLKADLLLDNQEYYEAVNLYHDLPIDAQERIKPRLVAALTNSCRRYLAKKEWSRARSCWNRVGPIDPDVAKDLVLRFLNLHPYLVPKTYKSNSSTQEEDMVQGGAQAGALSLEETRSTFKVFVFTLLVAVAWFAVGALQLGIVGIILPTDENNAVSGGSAVILVLSFVLMLASPIIGATFYYKRGRNRPPRTEAQAPSRAVPVGTYKRSEILLGNVDDSILLEVVKVVMDKLWKEEPVRR